MSSLLLKRIVPVYSPSYSSCFCSHVALDYLESRLGQQVTLIIQQRCPAADNKHNPSVRTFQLQI